MTSRHTRLCCKLSIGFFLSFVISGTALNAEVEALSPNEMGKIMVLMYHDIGDRETTWRRTPDNLERDLEALNQRGYVPISLTDFVRGRIRVPRGKSPIVITFDDGHPGQFQWAKSKYLPGEIKKPSEKSAVGILKKYHEAHHDFPARATFFLHGKRPFGEKKQLEEKLSYLIANQMDIGNHSTQHQNLGKKSLQNPELIQRAIGGQAMFLTGIISAKYPHYKIETYALCYGRRPRPRYQRFLHKGTFNNFNYTNIAILNVGSGPAYSPFDNRFRPQAIPRIRASEINTFGTGLYDWLRYFDENPNERYISDGNDVEVTVPRPAVKWINKRFFADVDYKIKKVVR